MPKENLPDRELFIKRPPEADDGPTLPVAYGEATVRHLLTRKPPRAEGHEGDAASYMLGGVTALDFGKGDAQSIVVVTHGRAVVSSVVFEGNVVPVVHDRDILMFDTTGRPVYELRRQDREVSVTIKVKVDSRNMRRALRRVGWSFWRLKHRRLARALDIFTYPLRWLARAKHGRPVREREVRK